LARREERLARLEAHLQLLEEKPAELEAHLQGLAGE
jgi:hypothetical protein